MWILGCAAAQAESGYQTINGTRVFTEIDRGRGVATFTNECGSQTLTQSELQGGAIPDQIIPCPRPGRERESNTGRSTPPPPVHDERAEPRARSARIAAEGDRLMAAKQYRQALQKYEEAKRIQLEANLVTAYQISKRKAERATCAVQLDTSLRHGNSAAREASLAAAGSGVCRRFPDLMTEARAIASRGAAPPARNQRAGLLCDNEVGTSTEAIGWKPDGKTREMVACVTVLNKCPYTINITARIAGLSRDSQEFAEHGKTAKICASKEGQEIRFTGMTRRR